MEEVVSNASSKSQVERTLERELADLESLPPKSQVEITLESDVADLESLPPESQVEITLERVPVDLESLSVWSREMEQVVSNASNSQVQKNLEWELTNVENLATPRFMYKVPQILHDANKEAYTPTVISIGPYHCRSKNLLSMHYLKIRYLQSFLKRTGLRLGTCVEMAQGWEEKVRGYYDEECGLNSDELVHMILTDGIFIVEFTWQWSNGNTIEGDKGIYEYELLKDDIMHDLMLLENQLPFFVLKGLGDLSFPGTNHGWIKNLTPLFIEHFDLMKTADLNLSRRRVLDFLGPCNNILHLVDFVHVICISKFSTALTINTFREHVRDFEVNMWVDQVRELELEVNDLIATYNPNTFQGPKLQLSRSATELQEAGVKLGCAQGLSLTNIVFMKNGVLQIPRLVVKRNTESLFRNIIAYEQCHRKGHKFRSYVILMDCLINTSQDVQLLVDSGIIQNSLGESEDVCTLFNNLYKMPMMDSREFRYPELCQKLNKYRRGPWQKWKARWFRWKLMLRRDYFSSPWSLISVIAAFILLGLTTIQTICSIKGVKW